MRIEFRGTPPADAYRGAPVGTIFEGQRVGDFFYADREPMVVWRAGGPPEPLEKGAFNDALSSAIEGEAAAIWGDDWSRAVAEIAGLNRRTTARDRVRKYGLPPGVVISIVALARREDAREMAGVIRAVARYVDAHPASDPLNTTALAVEMLEQFRGKRFRAP